MYNFFLNSCEFQIPYTKLETAKLLVKWWADSNDNRTNKRCNILVLHSYYTNEYPLVCLTIIIFHVDIILYCSSWCWRRLARLDMYVIGTVAIDRNCVAMNVVVYRTHRASVVLCQVCRFSSANLRESSSQCVCWVSFRYEWTIVFIFIFLWQIWHIASLISFFTADKVPIHKSIQQERKVRAVVIPCITNLEYIFQYAV